LPARDLETEQELLWQNSRAFAAQGNRKLSYALATKLTDAADGEIAQGARELTEDMEARGANPKRIKLKDPWRTKPLAAMTHLMLAAVLPVGIGGVVLQAVQSGEVRQVRTRSVAAVLPPLEAMTSAALPNDIAPGTSHLHRCWKEPENGEVLYRINPRVAAGHQIAVMNDTKNAAIVKVRSAFSKRLIAAVYMYPHASAALNGVPDGYYIVQYAFGSVLNEGCVTFADTTAAWQFPGTESLRTIATGDGPQQLQYSLLNEPASGEAFNVSPSLFAQN
jgi:hypothetical protein